MGLVCTLLLMASMPAYATRPTIVSGGFDYEYICDWPGELHGGNLFLHCTDTETWQGDLEGTVETEYWVIFYSSGLAIFSAKGTFEGSVLGKDGSLEYRNTGIFRQGATEWQGTWTMGHGTGGLENAHLQGTWHGPGDTPPLFSYDGGVHFDP